MRQVVLRSGRPQVVEVPSPSPSPGFLLVANRASVISSGTERATMSASGGSLPARAIRNPQLVRQTLEHARRQGLRDTTRLVRGAMTNDTPLGYATAGVVLHTGGVAQYQVGQRVACAGAGYASHAEVVSVPANLVAAVPPDVATRDAAFATLGAIALQGVRRAAPTLGERVVVSGLGLLGLLTVQIARAAGCQVVGIEPVERRRAIAAELGAELALTPAEAPAAVREWTAGEAADAVIVCASSRDDSIVNAALALLRAKGRLVPVGDVGLGLERGPLYEREADVLISTSYGPGRYDPTYEEGGIDYPLAYVRWTEQRNLGEFLRLLASGHVRVGPLVDLEVALEQAPEAYAAIEGDAPPLAAVIEYEETKGRPAEVVSVRRPGRRPRSDRLGVALVGAGSFVRAVHLPNLRARRELEIRAIVTRHSTTATDIARSLGGADAMTDWRAALDRPDVDLVVVGTRHDSHAEIAAAALRAGKLVFLEKPLGLTREEIDDVWAAADGEDRLAIGFNRRWAPLARRLREQLPGGPLHVLYRVSAPLPAGHWLNDPHQGGGRLLGEACHMFDFANWLCGRPLRVLAAALPARPSVETTESASVTTQYESGSVAVVHYSGEGSPAMPKERIEVAAGGRSWVLDDFAELTAYDAPPLDARAGKGHAELLAHVIEAARGETAFDPGLSAAYEAQSLALAALESLAGGGAVPVEGPPAQRLRATT